MRQAALFEESCPSLRRVVRHERVPEVPEIKKRKTKKILSNIIFHASVECHLPQESFMAHHYTGMRARTKPAR